MSCCQMKFLGCLTGASLVLLTSNSVQAQPVCYPPPPDMVAWYAGDTCWSNDLLGNHDGTYTGCPVCIDEYKVGGAAMFFAPADEQCPEGTYITVPHDPELDPGHGEFTIDAWIFTSAGGYIPIADKADTQAGYRLYLDDGAVVFEVCDGINPCITAGSFTVVNTGGWRHVAATLHRSGDNGGVLVYVDGQLEGISALLPLGEVATEDDLVIGATDGDSEIAAVFDGLMDEIEFHSRALTLGEIQSIYLADDAGKCKQQVPCVEPPADMVAWWAGDDCLPFDLLGDHHGTYGYCVGCPLTCPPTPKVGDGALAFSGEVGVPPGTHISVPHASALDPGSGEFTIDAWIRTTDGEGYTPIVEKFEGGYGYQLDLYNGKVQFGICDTYYCSVVRSLNVVSDGTWHHVAGVLIRGDGNCQIEVYVDGQWQNSALIEPCGNVGTTADVLIGASSTDGPYFTGSMDEVEIFRRALTGDEIYAIYLMGKCKPEPACANPPSDMLAWWPLDEQSGTTANDIASGNDGTYVGTPTPTEGMVDGALAVDVSNHVHVDGAPFNFGQNDFSIDAWVNVDDTGEVWIVDRTHAFHLAASAVAGVHPHFEYDCGTAHWPYPIPANTWVHLAVTVERNNPEGLKMYTNGTFAGWVPTCTYDIDYGDTPLGVGGAMASAEGIIDEVEIFERALAPEEIRDIYLAGAAGKCKACADPPTSMVAWWTGDDCWSADLLGNHPGTYRGCPVCPDSDMVGGGALAFAPQSPDCYDQATYIRVPHAPDLDPGMGEFTIDMWIRTQADVGPLAIKYDPYGYYFSLYWEGKPMFGVCDDTSGGCWAASSTTPVNDGTWHHLAGVVGGGGIALYVDGMYETGTGIPGLGDVSSTVDLLIGADGLVDNPSFFFDGEMDEIEIFNRALSDDEILAIYQAGGLGKCKPQPSCTDPPAGMLAWWPLDEDEGTTAEDIAGGHDATYVGAPTPIEGKVDLALAVDGSNHVQAEGAAFNFGQSDFSIDAWVKIPSGTIGETWIVDRTFGFHFAANTGPGTTPHLAYECGTAFSYAPLPPDTWVHLAVTVERDIVTKLYTNGTLTGVGAACAHDIDYGDTPLTIGGVMGGGSDERFIDEVEIFTRALTPSEVMDIYLAGSAGKCKGPCGGCPTDVDGSGNTGASDLAVLLGSWGPCSPGDACECLDDDGDGVIGAADLAVLLGSWGPCSP